MPCGACVERIVWMDHGCVKQIGPGAEVIAAYGNSIRQGQIQAA